MIFNFAQEFYIDPGIVASCAQVGIDKVNLYFKSKPLATGNRSGINNPGVTVYLVGTINGVPNLDDINNTLDPTTGKVISRHTRVEYNLIQATSDASIPTTFRFADPIFVNTNGNYAILIAFDGNEDFVLWTSVQGSNLLGSTTISPGPSGKYVGNMYSYISPPVTNTTPTANTANNASGNSVLTSTNVGNTSTTANSSYASTAWKPVTGTDLKFEVFIARYAINGIPVTNATTNATTTVTNSSINSTSNSFVITLGREFLEYIVFDRRYSRHHNVRGGEYIFQMSFDYPGGSGSPARISVVSGNNLVTANSLLPNGSAFNWHNVFATANVEYIIVNSLNHDSHGICPYPLFNQRHITNPTIRTNVRKVASILSNTVLKVDRPFDFTNSTATFFATVPVGKVYFKDTCRSFGLLEDVVVISETNCNGSVRFVNNAIEFIEIIGGGTGYNNTDIIYVDGFEDISCQVIGGYGAHCNVVTDSSGVIVDVFFSNTGCGFVRGEELVLRVCNSASNTGNTSNGSGLSVNCHIGCTLGTEYWGWDHLINPELPGGHFGHCQIVNIEVGEFNPAIYINNPGGTNFFLNHRIPFYVEDSDDTFCGRRFRRHDEGDEDDDDCRNFERHRLRHHHRSCITSRSNEFCIVYANCHPCNTNSNGTVVTINAVSNSDFMSTHTGNSVVYYSKYIINNNYNHENTNYGNAQAKHISTKVNFANGTYAEDAIVYLTAYRPPNTDIKVFLRVHNDQDNESFDDKDWTLLEQTDGIGVFSSNTDPTDFIELTYSFPAYPNTAFTLDGFASTTLSNDTITGSGTTYQANTTANVNAGDLVRIYQPLFPNTNYIVAIVNAVANDESFTINNPISNNGVAGDGLQVDLIGRIGNTTLPGLGYPLQAFHNITNDNVVRYYTIGGTEIDNYNTVQLKLVMLADNALVVPGIDDIRFVGSSS